MIEKGIIDRILIITVIPQYSETVRTIPLLMSTPSPYILTVIFTARITLVVIELYVIEEDQTFSTARIEYFECP